MSIRYSYASTAIAATVATAARSGQCRCAAEHRAGSGQTDTGERGAAAAAGCRR